jgi:hypothetical protein
MGVVPALAQFLQFALDRQNLTFQPFNSTFHLSPFWHGNAPPCPRKKILIPNCLWISFSPRPLANAAPLAPWLPIAAAFFPLGSAYPDESSISNSALACTAPLRSASKLAKKGGFASVSLRPLRCRGQSTPIPSPPVPLPSRSAVSCDRRALRPDSGCGHAPVNGLVDRPARPATM